MEDGHFASNIGDLVITANSNVLKTSVVLLTSNSDMPIHVHPPTLSTMINPHSISWASHPGDQRGLWPPFFMIGHTHFYIMP